MSMSAGRRPSHAIFLSLDSKLDRHIAGQIVTMAPNDDLAALTGLSVWVCCRSSQLEEAFALINRILAEGPYDLILWVIDRGEAQNIVEHGVRTETRAVPDEALRLVMEELKCA